jgi:hypothetical protein
MNTAGCRGRPDPFSACEIAHATFGRSRSQPREK